MKKMIVLLVSIISLCTCVQAQVDVNPINVARAFALTTPSHFDCTLRAEALLGEEFEQITMRFEVRKRDFAVIKLSINEVEIELPEPIYSLPLGKAGFLRNVNLHVDARTKSGIHAGDGYLHRQIVSKDDSLQVTLTPTEIRQEIAYDTEEYGTDVQLEIEDFHYGYGYGFEGGKFYVSLPPVGGSYHFILRTREGETIGSGWLEPFQPVSTPNDTYFGIKYIGNVIGVEFNENGYEDWISASVEFNCSIPVKGGNEMGKVLFTDVGVGGLEIISSDVWVNVQSATAASGYMPDVQLEDHSVTHEWGTETRVNTVGLNVGKVVITIIPKNNSSKRGWVTLHRYYTAPNGTVGVKGKSE